MSEVCFGFRSGGAATYVIDIADLALLKHPMDL
jgi:hypothetical protein